MESCSAQAVRWVCLVGSPSKGARALSRGLTHTCAGADLITARKRSCGDFLCVCRTQLSWRSCQTWWDFFWGRSSVAASPPHCPARLLGVKGKTQVSGAYRSWPQPPSAPIQSRLWGSAEPKGRWFEPTRGLRVFRLSNRVGSCGLISMLMDKSQRNNTQQESKKDTSAAAVSPCIYRN